MKSDVDFVYAFGRFRGVSPSQVLETYFWLVIGKKKRAVRRSAAETLFNAVLAIITIGDPSSTCERPYEEFKTNSKTAQINYRRRQ